MKFAKANVLLIGVALSLGACKKSAPAAGDTGGSRSVSSVEGDAGEGKKLDTYVEAHNSFVGTFGFEEKAADYRKSDIAHKTIDGPFSVDAGWISQGLDKLKAARALSGGASDLDAAADALIATMGKVQTRLAGLETYYSSKKYLDDQLARGKAEDAPMLAELDAAEKDFTKFGALLDVSLDKRDQAQLDMLKDKSPLKYNSKLALLHAKKLLGLFNGPDDVNKPALFATVDGEVAIIEKAIADAHAEAVKAGKTDPSGLSALTSMLGDYRELKQKHDVDELKSMITQYNHAVESSNTFGNLE